MASASPPLRQSRINKSETSGNKICPQTNPRFKYGNRLTMQTTSANKGGYLEAKQQRTIKILSRIHIFKFSQQCRPIPNIEVHFWSKIQNKV